MCEVVAKSLPYDH